MSLKTYNAFYFKTKNARNRYFDENRKSVKKRISKNYSAI